MKIKKLVERKLSTIPFECAEEYKGAMIEFIAREFTPREIKSFHCVSFDEKFWNSGEDEFFATYGYGNHYRFPVEYVGGKFYIKEEEEIC